MQLGCLVNMLSACQCNKKKRKIELKVFKPGRWRSEMFDGTNKIFIAEVYSFYNVKFVPDLTAFDSVKEFHTRIVIISNTFFKIVVFFLCDLP